MSNSMNLSLQIPKALPSLCNPHRAAPLSIPSKLKQNHHNPKPNKVPTIISGKLMDYFNPIKSSLPIQVGALLCTVVQPVYAVTGENNMEYDLTRDLTESGIAAFIYFLIAPVVQPVYAVTGENNMEYDLTRDLTESGIAAFIYFLIAPFKFLQQVVQPVYAVTGENNMEYDLTRDLTESGIAAFIYFLIAPPLILNWLRIRWYRKKLLETYVAFMFVFMFFPGLLLWAPFLNFRKFPRDPSMKYPWSTPEDLSKIPKPVLKYPWASPEDYDNF